uniref:Uncharacterized protein n=1 Tax=Physcomitrium patens TaxID=3218 RepID=A0A2K1JPU9_PHYPA|nr:hypothetical protein PHYPA_015950 [Physcomitrium patens]
MRALIKTRAGVCRWSVIVSEEASCQTLCFQELFCLLTRPLEAQTFEDD